MPHFYTTKIDKLSFPINKDGFDFKYIASSKKNSKEKLIFVSYGDKSFFLQELEKRDGFLVKAEKLTKINSIAIIHRALNTYASLINANITFSNISPKIEKKVEINQYLKNIDFFINKKFNQEVWIEIGFGSGRHLLFQAENNPDILFVGLEIHKPSIEQVLNLIEIKNLKNIFILDYDAREFMELLSANLVGKIFIHFPVPWDKKPHRRVISKEFLDEALRVLKVDGSLELRTDSINYFEYSYLLVNTLDKIEVEIKKNEDLNVTSKYEDRWKREKKDIFDLIIKNKTYFENDEEIIKLNFEKSFDLIKVWQNFKNFTYKNDNIFLHLEDICKTEDRLIIKLSFGQNSRSEHKYIMLEKDNTYYFPTSTISTKSNRKIHTIIKELLNG